MCDRDCQPCWYNHGVWHDADNKPVKDDKKEYIDTIKSLESDNIVDERRILEPPLLII